MTRKLPKATTRTLDDVKKAATGPAPRGPARAAPKPTPEPKPKPEPRSGQRAAAAHTADARSVAGGGPARVTEDAIRAAHNAQAWQIVERAAAWSAAGGMIPIAAVDIASVTAIQVDMIRKLAQHCGLPAKTDNAKAIVAGLTGGVASSGLGDGVGAVISLFSPLGPLVGLGVSSVAAASLTRLIGRAFILNFETEGAALALDPGRIRAHFLALGGR